MYQNFIGIDISKADFAVSVYGQNHPSSFENSQKGFNLLYKNYRHFFKNSLVVLETTGGHEMNLLRYLLKKKIAVHRADTRKVKYFIRSLGVQGKTDSLDAQGLARYAKERFLELAIYEPLQLADQRLVKWIQRRLELKQILIQEKNRRQAPEQEELVDSFESIIQALTKEIQLVDEKIKEIINQDSTMRSKQAVLAEIPGIGSTLSAYMIGAFPELGKRNRREIASLAGLAPFPCESGKKVGYRSTKGGRQSYRSILFMAAMTASRSKTNLGEFYRKLIAAGKKKMVAMVALMRKILVIANAKVKECLAKSTNLQAI